MIRNYQFKEDVFVPTDLDALIRAFSVGNLTQGHGFLHEERIWEKWVQNMVAKPRHVKSSKESIIKEE